jgi:hypothetical protein
MPNDARNPFVDVMSLLGQPAQHLGRTVDSYRAAVTGFFDSVQTFRETMEAMQATVVRVNRLLEDIEEPIRALTPQLTKSAQRADRLMDAMAGPLDRLVPLLSRLADTLSAPAMRELPGDLTELVAALGELPGQLAPLGRFAQSAGGLFGLPGFSAFSPSRTHVPVEAQEASSRSPLAQNLERSPAKRSGTKRSASKRPAAKKSTAKNSTAKKSTAKKSIAKKSPKKKSPAKRRSAAGSTAPRAADTFARSAAKRAT